MAETRESCDMIRQPTEDACLDGPPGSYFFDVAASGQRRLWFVLPNGHTGVINIRPVVASEEAHPSWEWNGDDVASDPDAIGSLRRHVAWLLYSRSHGELLMDANALEVALRKIRALPTYSISQGICIDPSPDRLLKADMVYQIIDGVLGSPTSGEGKS